MKFFYVYLLESEKGGDFYVGFTEDLQARLKKHNAGEISHTTKNRPWRIKTAIAFTAKTTMKMCNPCAWEKLLPMCLNIQANQPFNGTFV